MRLTHAALAALLATTSAVTAQEGGNPENGAALAGEYCVRCHDVAPGGAFKMYPPSFASIAVFRPREQITARIWFPSMHTVMPQMVSLLTRENVADLTAYIMSLETAE